MGGKSGSHKKSVVGYKYYASMRLALCHGKITALREIWFADKVAWEGNIQPYSAATWLSVIDTIDQEGLFGGELSEGGVAGGFGIGFGSTDQELYGVDFEGETWSTSGDLWTPVRSTYYRGLAVLSFSDFYFGTNPYLKDISAVVERFWDGWEPDLARVGAHYNPAHIIYESLTDTQWGLGYDPSVIDQDSFRDAAQTLRDDGYGLSLLWADQQSLEDFINDVNEHIDGHLYLNPKTGLWTLKLVREGDPVVTTIGPQHARMTSFKRKLIGETANELNLKWTNPDTEEYVSITVHNDANIEAHGQVITSTKEYPGIRTEALARRVAMRDLQTLSATLATIELEGDRSLWGLNPGDLVEITWPPRKIVSLKCRVGEVTHPTSDSNLVRLTLVEDVFSQISADFTGENNMTWEDGRQPAGQFDEEIHYELPYWYLAQNIDMASVEPEVGYGSVLAISSNADVQYGSLYTSQVRPSGDVYVLQYMGRPTARATLSEALTKDSRSAVALSQDDVSPGGSVGDDPFLLLVDSTGRQEIVRVDGNLDADDQTGTISRGLMDTHPLDWPAGSHVYFIGDEQFLPDGGARSLGETYSYKVTMQTSIEQSTLDDAEEHTATIDARQGRPYPPQDIKINGEYWPESLTATSVTVTWSNRNRLLQDGNIQVPWDGANVVPEDGTEITCTLSNDEGDSVETTVPATARSVTFDNPPVGAMTLRVASERDGLGCYLPFTHRFDLVLVGYGNSYGLQYGGSGPGEASSND